MFTRIRRVTTAAPRCPYCHGRLRRDAHAAGLDVVACDACATPHHAACFAEHSRCTVLGCASDSARLGSHALDAAGLRAAIERGKAPRRASRAYFAISLAMAGFAH